jgi:hypothetical protein
MTVLALAAPTLAMILAIVALLLPASTREVSK